MAKDNRQLPDEVKRSLRKLMLGQSKDTSSLDIYELELFEWYSKETQKVLDEMLSTEQEYIREQVDAGQEDVNDSGIVAVEYYLKRVHYSHVIYMASLLEIFLERECDRLTAAIGTRNMPFKLTELKGDQWSTKRKFLERYGQFAVPDEIWHEVRNLTSLRNNLVHDNGAVSELAPSEKTALSKRPGIAFNDSEIVIEAEYVAHAFAAIKRFCQHIEVKVSEAIGRAIQLKCVK